jgi:hypothetical protein
MPASPKSISQYRNLAPLCARVADQSDSIEAKAALHQMEQAWLDLAQIAEASSRQNSAPNDDK